MATYAKIRTLTDEEHKLYSGAAAGAVNKVAPFRDGVAILNPFYDPTAKTAYTDRYCRVGLGPWFFEELTNEQRAIVVLHEVMHVLNNHFIRGENLSRNGQILNIAGDYEINCGLETLPRVTVDFGILPDKKPANFPRYKSMEQYYHLIREEMKNEDSPFTLSQQCSCGDDEGPGKNDDCTCGSAEDSAGQEDQASSAGQGGAAPEEGAAPSQEQGAEGSSSEAGGSTGPQCPAHGENNSSGESGGAGQEQGEAGEGSGGGAGAGDSQKGDSSTCPVHGNGTLSPCDTPTDARSEAADEAGITRASDSEQNIAKKNTAVRIAEELKKGTSYGNGTHDEFLKIVQKQMTPPKVPWQTILRRIISKESDAIIRGRADYSYRRINRRYSDSKYIFPGMVQYIPTIMFAIDTSGSMSGEDYRTLLSEVEGILKACSKGKNSFKVFPIDTEVKGVQTVSNVKQVQLKGGGGTDMSVALSYVNSLNKKEMPDLFVLATDGYVPWEPYIEQLKHATYRHVLLITTKGGYDSVPEAIKRMAPVIDISNEEKR